MFTGLIEEVGIIKNVRKSDDGIFLEIFSNIVIEGTKIGDSITINGACQTVTELGNDYFTVFASRVTCDVTTLGSFNQGTRVNLERAMLASSRFGGHIVQGHVDGKGMVKDITRDQNGIRIEIDAPEDIMRYIVQRGSVAVDGISLTVVSLYSRGFAIYIIPETIKNTTLDDRKQGDEVNIEVDILAKYVEKMMTINTIMDNEKSLKEKLIQGGFI